MKTGIANPQNTRQRIIFLKRRNNFNYQFADEKINKIPETRNQLSTWFIVNNKKLKIEPQAYETKPFETHNGKSKFYSLQIN